MNFRKFKFVYITVFIIVLLIVSCNQNNNNETCFETASRILDESKITYIVDDNSFNISCRKEKYKFNANYMEESDTIDYDFSGIKWLSETYDYIKNATVTEKKELYERFPNIEDFFDAMDDAFNGKNTIISDGYIKYANDKLKGCVIEFPSYREMTELKDKNPDEEWYGGLLILTFSNKTEIYNISCEYMHNNIKGFFGQSDETGRKRFYGECPAWFVKAMDIYQNQQWKWEVSSINIDKAVKEISDLFFDRLLKG